MAYLARNRHVIVGALSAAVALLALIFGRDAMLVVAAFTLAAFAWRIGERMLASTRAARQRMNARPAEPSEPCIFRTFSVYVNHRKIGLAAKAKLTLSEIDTVRTAHLRLEMYVPTVAPLERLEELSVMRTAFAQGQPLHSVSCAPIAGEVMTLRRAKVRWMEIETDHVKGTTTAVVMLETDMSFGGLELVGPVVSADAA